MKIIFVFFVALIFSDVGSTEAKVGTRHGHFYVSTQPPAWKTYPTRYPRSTWQPPPQVYRRRFFDGLNTQTLILFYVFTMLLSTPPPPSVLVTKTSTTPATTPSTNSGNPLTTPTTASTTLPAATESEPTTGEASTEATTTTTKDPFAEWTVFRTCRYLRPDNLLTWNAAQDYCEAQVPGATLASAGFNMEAGDRAALISKLQISSFSYWVGVTAGGVTPPGSSPTSASWVLGGNPGAPAPGPALNLVDTDGTSLTTVCGRFYASSSPDTLYFEGCDIDVYHYVCEYCGTI